MIIRYCSRVDVAYTTSERMEAGMKHKMRARAARRKPKGILSRGHRAQTYTEYALVFVCVIVALIGGYELVGGTINNTVSNVNEQVTNA